MKNYDRIAKNEERLDKVLSCIKKLDIALDEFHDNKKKYKRIG